MLIRPVVCTFESRRANDMDRLIQKFGGDAFVAPSMQEVPLENNSEAIDAIRQMIDGQITAIVLLTGVGTDAMLKLAASIDQQEALINRLGSIPLLVRGPKPAMALAKIGLKYTIKAPEPNTWEELVDAIKASEVELSGGRVAIQEYGISNPSLTAAIENMGATVVPVPVYRWTLPDDIQPLKTAIQKTIEGEFEALLFTSAQQIRHVLQIADDLKVREPFMNATKSVLVSSIGPTCTDALQECGLAVGFEASPPKMGPFVRGTLDALKQPAS